MSSWCRILVGVAALALLLLSGCDSVASPPTTSSTGAAAAGAISSADRDHERYAAGARWSPGQLQEHFRKHPEGYHGVQDYDDGARDTIRQGALFTYRDRETREVRLGFYDERTNRFTAVTRDGGRITTHFRPDRGADYVRRLPESTYQ